jgi:hypothetical protein
MKQILLIFLLLFTLQCSYAQTSYYKGEWTMLNKQDLFTGIFKIEIKKDGTVNAELLWTYLAVDSTRQDMIDLYKGKKGRSGIEYATGNFSAAGNDLYFEGKEKDDPYVILGVDKYHLKLAANKQAIYGTTETGGTNEGLLYAVKMDNETGKKEFSAARSKIKK